MNMVEICADTKVGLGLGKAIQQARQAKKMTQATLAKSINEKPVVVNQYENGKAIPNGQVCYLYLSEALQSMSPCSSHHVMSLTRRICCVVLCCRLLPRWKEHWVQNCPALLKRVKNPVMPVFWPSVVGYAHGVSSGLFLYHYMYSVSVSLSSFQPLSSRTAPGPCLMQHVSSCCFGKNKRTWA